MDNLDLAQSERRAKWQEHQSRVWSHYETLDKILDDQVQKLKLRHQKLQTQKDELARTNGGAEACDSDILNINAGGQIVSVSRGTLTEIKGSLLEALFSGRWENSFPRDMDGNIFLDVNPYCFICIVDYLKERMMSAPNDPPQLPQLDIENQVFLDGLMTAFKLPGYPHDVDSVILTDPSHIMALHGFLVQENPCQRLTLLYRGTRDGFPLNTFHEKCDNQGPTVTVVKSAKGYIFGGYSDKSWTSSTSKCWVESQKSFLFGLLCHGGRLPVKMRLTNNQPIIHSKDNGPRFGKKDLFVRGSVVSSVLGKNYINPLSGDKLYFLGSKAEEVVSEIEVFSLSPENSPLCLALDDFPEDLHSSIEAEKKALSEASNRLFHLEHAFKKEAEAVKVFCTGSDDEIAYMNASGHNMAVKHSTLSKYPESVLYKHFVDPKWSKKRKREMSLPSESNVGNMSASVNSIEDLFSEFHDVTASKLQAFEDEARNDLGICQSGKMALMAKAIQKLLPEENQKTVMFLEHSNYSLSKIIDHMRLKAMNDALGVTKSTPPVVREQARKRFKVAVEYYFPTDNEASEFLG